MDLHLPHFEDLPLTGQVNLITHVIDSLLQSTAIVQAKVDGRPAIILGHDATGIFVGKTKHAIDDVTYRCYDINDPDLENTHVGRYSKLILVWAKEQNIDKGTILVGDVIKHPLGTMPMNVVEYDINTTAPISVVFHSFVVNGKLHPLETIPFVNTLPEMVHVCTNYVGHINLPRDIKASLTTMRKLIQLEYSVPTSIHSYMNQVPNRIIKESNSITTIRMAEQTIIPLVKEKLNTKIASLKTQKGKAVWQQKLDELMADINSALEDIDRALLNMSRLANIRQQILANVDAPTLEFVPTNIPKWGEGMVITIPSLHQVKLVNRETFSYENFKKHGELITP